jgi:glycosyltransferase involved in cell wall biosynthesis
MKILAYITYYFPYRSGLSEYARRINEYFVTKQNTVTTVAIRHDLNLPQGEMVGGVNICREPYLFRISKGFLSFSWILNLFPRIKKSDLVTIHLPQPEAMLAAFTAKLLKKKVIAIYHCDVVLGSRFHERITQWLVDFFHKMTIVLADRVVINSEDYAAHSRLAPLFNKKTSYIPPPFNEYRIDEKEKLKLVKFYPDLTNQKVLKIGFVGRIAREKGIDYLISALPKISVKLKLEKNYPERVKLFIAGPRESAGEKDYRKKIGKLIESHRDMVVQIGELEDGAMGAFLSCLNVLTVPSVNATEAYGMVQVEAMRLGVPVVASNLPGVRELVSKTGYGKLAYPKDSGDLAEKILGLVEEKIRFDPEEYQELFDPQVSLKNIAEVAGI